MFTIIAIIILVLDQWTKHLVLVNMTADETIGLFPGVFDLTFVKNTGAAFGIFQGKTVFLSVVTIVLLTALCVYAITQRKKIPKLESISLALIVSGGLGNLVSRILLGYVVDFFNFYFWPVFNVADIAICIGCGLLVLSVLILEPIKAKKHDQ